MTESRRTSVVDGRERVVPLSVLIACLRVVRLAATVITVWAGCLVDASVMTLGHPILIDIVRQASSTSRRFRPFWLAIIHAYRNSESSRFQVTFDPSKHASSG
jgi:hypothetical protein